MFRSLFKPRPVSATEQGRKPEGISPGALREEEILLPSLHRTKIHMTADLIRRMEEEGLRKKYHIFPSKEGTYL